MRRFHNRLSVFFLILHGVVVSADSEENFESLDCENVL
jgi:hypothetical protein